MKIVYMGTPDFAVAPLEAIIRAGHEVTAVVTQPDKPKGRGYTLTPPPVKVYAEEKGLPVYQPKTLRDEAFAELLRQIDPEVIVVVAFGKILPANVLDYPKYGCVNVHGSLLPKYRGPNPYYWVIKNQEKESGVTFHLMDDKFDTGAILSQEIVKIYPTDTGKTLKERTVLTARGVVSELLNVLSEDVVIPLQQREDQATYFSYPEEFELNFKKSSNEIYANIRAHYPWNKTYFYHKITALTPNPHKISIEENKTEYTDYGTIVDFDIETKTLSILCGDNKVLKMSDINLYKNIDKRFTKNYIKLEIATGDIIV